MRKNTSSICRQKQSDSVWPLAVPRPPGGFSDSISETSDANYTGTSLRERARPGLGIEPRLWLLLRAHTATG
jgi:hypothetical protein